MTNSLSTRGTERFLTRAGDDAMRMKLAVVVQMTYVGAPAIYYGEETGLGGGNDPDNRRTFSWDSSSWNQDLLKHYQTLIWTRRQTSGLTDGSFKTLLIDDGNKLYSYGRWDAQSWAIVVLNNDGQAHAVSIAAYQLSIPDGTSMADALTGATHTVTSGMIQAPASALPAHSGLVLTAKVP